MENGLEQQISPQRVVLKREISFLIFRVKVCILSYHIALDVVATNLHKIILIDNSHIFLKWFYVSNLLQSNFA